MPAQTWLLPPLLDFDLDAAATAAVSWHQWAFSLAVFTSLLTSTHIVYMWVQVQQAKLSWSAGFQGTESWQQGPKSCRSREGVRSFLVIEHNGICECSNKFLEGLLQVTIHRCCFLSLALRWLYRSIALSFSLWVKRNKKCQVSSHKILSSLLVSRILRKVLPWLADFLTLSYNFANDRAACASMMHPMLQLPGLIRRMPMWG